MNRIPRLTLYVLACILAAAAALSCAGCGMLGIATVDDLNDESARLQSRMDAGDAADRAFTTEAVKASAAQTKAVFAASFAWLEPIVPGVQNAAAAMFDENPLTMPVAPAAPPKLDPRPNESQLPWWAEEAATVLAAAGLSYLGINTARDRKRRMMGEATNVAEAVALGQVTPPAPRNSAA